MNCVEYRELVYGSLMIHNLMLSDEVRNKAYAEAIRANIKEGDVVVDVGAGTGLLSLLAAKAGAKVYAIEPAEIIEVAKQNARNNGVEDKIIFMNCLAEDADIPEKVDCIISEWMGVMALQENMLTAVTSIRDKYLKQGGKLLPEKVSLHLGLISSERIYDETVGKWRKPLFGLDYNHLADCNAKDTHLITARPEEIGSDPVNVMDIDVRNVNVRDIYEMNTKLISNNNARYQGVLGWFKADFPKNIVLDTSPYQPTTHWQQLYFPFENPIDLKKDDGINFLLKAEEDKHNSKLLNFAWGIK